LFCISEEVGVLALMWFLWFLWGESNERSQVEVQNHSGLNTTQDFERSGVSKKPGGNEDARNI